MSKVTADISMSLDGFVAEPDPGADNPLGDGPGRLHDGMFSEKTAAHAEIVDEIYATTGAVLIGKRMFDVGVEPWGDPPSGCPCSWSRTKHVNLCRDEAARRTTS